jgi:hypothetical protein
VLLHHLAAALPINLTFDLYAGSQINASFQPMPNAPVFRYFHVNHMACAEHPQVTRLSAAGGIKSRSIKCDRFSARVRSGLQYARSKARQAGLTPLKFFSRNGHIVLE